MALDHPLSPCGSTYCVLDANVLLPARLSDVLFDLHAVGLYFPRWTVDIENEFLDHWTKVSMGLYKTTLSKNETVKLKKHTARTPDTG